jgi:diguanylate cyclase (GGDEF)-like protein
LRHSYADNVANTEKKEGEAVQNENDTELMLKNILNGMEALITVCDADNFEILFLNDAIRANFGLKDDCVGQLCHKVLQGLDEPCSVCPYEQLRREPDKTLIWEHHERIKGAILRKSATLIDWPGGRKGHLEYAIDITSLKKAEKELEYRNELLQTVNKISVILLQADSENFDGNLSRAMGIMSKAVCVDRAYIWENYINDGDLCCHQTHEWSEGAEPQQDKDFIHGVSYNDVIPDWYEVFKQKRCINGIVREMADTGSKAYPILMKQGILSVLVVPIYVKDELWGFVGFDDCHAERVFTENEVSILYSASELIANAVVRNNMERDLQLLETEVDKIYYDSLTGIYNRRYLDENITRTFQILSRSNGYCSVMMVDIDYFKKYNDTYGHSQGDECLKIVAKTLHDSIARSEDYVSRYGGEEFAVILPNADSDGAKVVAEKMLANIRDRNIPHETNDDAGHVTISIGVVTGRIKFPFDAYKYLQRADEMLYLAKRSGRNRYAFTAI